MKDDCLLCPCVDLIGSKLYNGWTICGVGGELSQTSLHPGSKLDLRTLLHLLRVVERVCKNHGGEGEVTVVELDQKTKGQL